ncbi:MULTISPECIES: recombinase family protein [Bacillus]|uniref:Resolvase/invertase-type recombinase catalytic domain-containing protein n=1 Tax=Bacillus sonorensis TaxID=119858 RepID=A0ABN5AMH2_9BACI|nr:MULTISPECIES: recombinase family protein [Bacillus]ASB89332.1 hypothetical protein S101395_02825 [Bacillus sonorensis]MEC0338355.1 recombinase family protein [Bacillus sonorensis]MEC0425212.1 recombinase family protein [Bacillus sonorensis]MEC0460766.1 recombinase family protein [Bacillus sonorensis]MEC0526421.1 recombinase family protein [Bacillus sonorensis]
MIYGYTRMSMEIQKPMLLKHIDELNKAGAEKVYYDVPGRHEQQALNELITDLKSGDTVYLLSLDRLSRDEEEMKSILEKIKAKGAEIKVLVK